MELEFSELTIKILLLFFPGIIVTLITDKLTEKDEEFSMKFFIKSFVYGLISYFTLYIIVGIINNFLILLKNIICNCNTDVYQIKLNFLDCLMNGNKNINYIEIIVASLVSIFVSLVVSYIDNKNLIYKIANKLGISKKFGDLDVWAHIFNGLEKDTWLIIRDYDLGFMYVGWANAFSSNHKESELLLKDVIVYNNDTAEEMYKTDAIYFSNLNGNIRIELKKVD